VEHDYIAGLPESLSKPPPAVTVDRERWPEGLARSRRESGQGAARQGQERETTIQLVPVLFDEGPLQARDLSVYG